jgi:HD superfamily phosphohydrolase YqeK
LYSRDPDLYFDTKFEGVDQRSLGEKLIGKIMFQADYLSALTKKSNIVSLKGRSIKKLIKNIYDKISKLSF